MERAILVAAGGRLTSIISCLVTEPYLWGIGDGRGVGHALGAWLALEMERDLIFKTLAKVKDNRTHAAKELGISIRTLRNKLREYRDMGYQVEAEKSKGMFGGTRANLSSCRGFAGMCSSRKRQNAVRPSGSSCMCHGT